MPPRPRRVQKCPVCHQNMSWFGDHWVCVNIKTHDRALTPKLGQVVPFKKRKKKNG